MLIRRPLDIPSSDITDESLFWNRREFLKAAGLSAAALSAGVPMLRAKATGSGDDDKLTPYDDITGYNNYYEFGTDKGDPKANAGRLRTSPWKVEIHHASRR